MSEIRLVEFHRGHFPCPNSCGGTLVRYHHWRGNEALVGASAVCTICGDVTDKCTDPRYGFDKDWSPRNFADDAERGVKP